jgi:predicted regulator of Ras-like GTPase activity (Roadblock/LC7/MglB family)
LASGWGSDGISAEYVSVSVKRVSQAADALAHLTEISTQIQAAVVLDREGAVQVATVDDERAGRIASSALELFRQADAQREQELVQLDAALAGGSVFVVRDEERLIAATTAPGSTAGLVFYDLKSALRSLAAPPAKPKPKPKPKRAPAKRTAATRKKKDADA